MQKYVAIIQQLGAETDEDLQMLQAALSINPLPAQLAEFAPFLSEAHKVINFLLRIDALVAPFKALLSAV